MESPLTCLHLGVVSSVSDFLLTEEVVHDLHPNGGLRVTPLQYHQCAAGLMYSGEMQAGGTIFALLSHNRRDSKPLTHRRQQPQERNYSPSLFPPGSGHVGPKDSLPRAALPGWIHSQLHSPQLNLELRHCNSTQFSSYPSVCKPVP